MSFGSIYHHDPTLIAQVCTFLPQFIILTTVIKTLLTNKMLTKSVGECNENEDFVSTLAREITFT